MDTPYINIGTPKYSFWIHSSKLIINQLRKYPLLYGAIEECALSAQQKHFAIGILTLSQALQLFNKEIPPERHEIAHGIFEKRPSEAAYNSILKDFKRSAQTQYELERKRHADADKYHEELLKLWNIL